MREYKDGDHIDVSGMSDDQLQYLEDCLREKSLVSAREGQFVKNRRSFPILNMLVYRVNYGNQVQGWCSTNRDIIESTDRQLTMSEINDILKPN